MPNQKAKKAGRPQPKLEPCVFGLLPMNFCPLNRKLGKKNSQSQNGYGTC
jgi:hypothetical protein